MKILALITDTFREIYSKRIIFGIVAIEVIVLVITALVLFSDGMQAEYEEARQTVVVGPLLDTIGTQESTKGFSPEDSALLDVGKPMPLDSLRDSTQETVQRQSSRIFTTSDSVSESSSATSDLPRALVEKVTGPLAAFGGTITLALIFLGLFATAGIVPSMMEKGTVDLLLSKPLSRTTLLLGRALGGILALTINQVIFVTVLWALFGMATGLWLTSFLTATIVVPLFTFLVIYSGVLLLNVITDSWVLPMSLAYVHLMILSTFLYSRESTLFVWIESTLLHRFIDGLYWILPQTMDLRDEAVNMIYTSGVESITPFIQGTLFMAVMLGVATWKFSRKEF